MQSNRAASALEPESRWLGRRVPRSEDDPLLRGGGRYVDDIEIPGMLHGAFLRSGVAHGRILNIDASAARSIPGVHGVFLYADLRRVLTSDRIPLAMPSAAIRHRVDPSVLADLFQLISDLSPKREDCAQASVPQVDPTPSDKSEINPE